MVEPRRTQETDQRALDQLLLRSNSALRADILFIDGMMMDKTKVYFLIHNIIIHDI